MLDRYTDVILITCTIGIVGISGVLYIVADGAYVFLMIGNNLPYFLFGVLMYQYWGYFKKYF